MRSDGILISYAGIIDIKGITPLFRQRLQFLPALTHTKKPKAPGKPGALALNRAKLYSYKHFLSAAIAAS